ncbi:MAG: hypothetical protein FJ191_03810 [Gammaproteobacteria bacterium]|nr:hypothetical protein [Gammaproteobacteria bacterium]
MATDAERLLRAYLAPTPLPRGSTSRDLVRRALDFDAPARIPYSFWHPLRSDFCELTFVEEMLGTGPARPREPGRPYRDEWGVGLRVSGGRFDHAVEHPLADLDPAALAAHRFPDPAAPARYAPLERWIAAARRAGKFCVGFDPVLLYERATELAGFETLLTAHRQRSAELATLFGRLADLTIAAIGRWADLGVDAFMTWDDLGTQQGLPMGLAVFRQHYRPHYARIVAAAHGHGLRFIWHQCGDVPELIGEMLALGVDVVQLDQPRLIGHDRLAAEFGGRICFWNAVDIQWATQPQVSDADLRREVAAMVAPFAGRRGGFMARHYPHGGEIGLGPARERTIWRAFLGRGCALRQSSRIRHAGG